jgi:phage gp46-like protein
MTIDRFQGDPYVTIGPDGSDMLFKGGQPVMDQGVENAVNISLFTEPNWWGNVLFDEASQKIGSRYQETAKPPITLSKLEQIRSAALTATEWLTSENIASNISANVTNPEASRIDAIILVQPPGRDFEVLLASTYGGNWISQKIDPANLKV